MCRQPGAVYAALGPQTDAAACRLNVHVLALLTMRPPLIRESYGRTDHAPSVAQLVDVEENAITPESAAFVLSHMLTDSAWPYTYPQYHRKHLVDLRFWTVATASQGTPA